MHGGVLGGGARRHGQREHDGGEHESEHGATLPGHRSLDHRAKTARGGVDTTAHGRHYSDVPPIKGVFRGGAAAELESSVQMTRTDATQRATP